MVDLYQWVRARYLVWCEGCRNKSKAQLSSALDRISERITLAFQTLSRPEAIRGPAIKNKKFIYVSMLWRREWDSNPRYGRQDFGPFSDYLLRNDWLSCLIGALLCLLGRGRGAPRDHALPGGLLGGAEVVRRMASHEPQRIP